MKNIVAIIQGRMGSSRLPGKILLDIAGRTMLERVVERTRQAQSISAVVVATTRDAADDAVAALCASRGYPCYRGSQHDVLDRYYHAARQADAEVVVRITADCPVIDPALIDRTVHAFFGDPAGAIESPDFAANRLPPPWSRTFPIGLDTEVCSYADLERAWQEADQPHHREHVMPFFYEGISPADLAPHQSSPHVAYGTSPRGFRVALLHHYPDYGKLRWTVDTAEDLAVLRQIYAHFDHDTFSWLEVLEIWNRDPDLARLNASIQHKHYQEVDRRGQP